MAYPENIGNDLFCSSMLEKNTYEMYHEISLKTDHPIVKPLLVAIAQDSLKHSKLFEEFGKNFITTPPSTKQCQKRLGKILLHIDGIRKLVKNIELFSSKELSDLINKLAFIEFYMSEEYSILIKVETLKYMSQTITNNYGIDFESTVKSEKNIFGSIIQDEQQHHRTLLEVNDLLTKKEQQKELHPKIKYQNPDAWTFPPLKKSETD